MNKILQIFLRLTETTQKISLCLMRCLNAAFLSKSWKVSAGFPALKFTPIICAKKSSLKPLKLAGQSHRVSPSSLCHSKSLPVKVSLITEFLHVRLFIIVSLVPQNINVSALNKKKKTTKLKGSLGDEYAKGSALWESFATYVKYVQFYA